MNQNFFPAVSNDGEFYLNPNRGFWSIVRPPNVDIINYIRNPSFETGTTAFWHNYFFDNNSTFGIVNIADDPDNAYDGAYALKVTQTIPNNDYGVQYAPIIWADGSGMIPIEVGESFYIMAHVKANKGDVIQLIGSFDTLSAVPGFIPRITQSTATGRWQRLRVKVTNQAAIPTHVNVVVRIIPAGSGPKSFLIDAVTATNINISDYFDGDTPGATWYAQPHLTGSIMSKFSRELGEEIFLNDIGFNVVSYSGHGMTPVINDTIPYSQGGGAYYNRTWPDVRTISLVGDFLSGRGIKDNHKNASRMLELVGLHRYQVDPQPFILRYRLTKGNADTTGTLEIPVVYKAGLEGLVNSLNQERVTLQLDAYEELFWRSYRTKTVAITPNAINRVCYNGTAPAPMRWRVPGQTVSAANVDLEYIENQSLDSGIYFYTNPMAVFQPIVEANDLIVGSLDSVCASNLLRNKTTGAITNQNHHVKRPDSVPAEFVLLHGNNDLYASFDPHDGITPKAFVTYRERYLSATDVWRTRPLDQLEDTVLRVVTGPGTDKQIRRIGDHQSTFDPHNFKEAC